MLCRLCLKTNITLQNIINCKKKCAELTLLEFLNRIFGIDIQINDPFSKFICLPCEDVVQYVGSHLLLYKRNQLILQGKQDLHCEDDVDVNQIDEPHLNNAENDSFKDWKEKETSRRLEFLKYYYQKPTTAIRELIKDKSHLENETKCEIEGENFTQNNKPLFSVKETMAVEVCKYCSEIFKTKHLLDTHCNTMHKWLRTENQLKKIMGYKEIQNQHNPYDRIGRKRPRKNLIFDTKHFPNLSYLKKSRNRNGHEYSKNLKIDNEINENNAESLKGEQNWYLKDLCISLERCAIPNTCEQNNSVTIKQEIFEEPNENQHIEYSEKNMWNKKKTKKYISSVLSKLDQIKRVRNKMAYKKMVEESSYRKIGNTNDIEKNVKKPKGVNKKNALENDTFQVGKAGQSLEARIEVPSTKTNCRKKNARNSASTIKDGLGSNERLVPKQLHQKIEDEKNMILKNIQLNFKNIKQWKKYVSKILPKLRQIRKTILSNPSQRSNCTANKVADFPLKNKPATMLKNINGIKRKKGNQAIENKYNCFNLKECYISINKCPTPSPMCKTTEVRKQNTRYTKNDEQSVTQKGRQVKNLTLQKCNKQSFERKAETKKANNKFVNKHANMLCIKDTNISAEATTSELENNFNDNEERAPDLGLPQESCSISAFSKSVLGDIDIDIDSKSDILEGPPTLELQVYDISSKNEKREQITASNCNNYSDTSVTVNRSQSGHVRNTNMENTVMPLRKTLAITSHVNDSRQGDIRSQVFSSRNCNENTSKSVTSRENLQEPVSSFVTKIGITRNGDNSDFCDTVIVPENVINRDSTLTNISDYENVPRNIVAEEKRELNVNVDESFVKTKFFTETNDKTLPLNYYQTSIKQETLIEDDIIVNEVDSCRELLNDMPVLESENHHNDSVNESYSSFNSIINEQWGKIFSNNQRNLVTDMRSEYSHVV